MTAPDYPLLGMGSYETYQIAHIATYIAERLARYRRTGDRRADRAARAEAAHDLAAAATALDSAVGASEPTPTAELPRPMDASMFTAARELLASGPRSAEVVSLEGVGRAGWGVVGHVPGIGAVGAVAGRKEIAEALRTHFLTQPTEELAPWAVTCDPLPMPTLPAKIDLATYVKQHLDPQEPRDQAIARALRGLNTWADAAIRERFKDVDLDAPVVVRPQASKQGGSTEQARSERQPAPRPEQQRTANRQTHEVQRPRAQTPTTAHKAPDRSAGP